MTTYASPTRNGSAVHVIAANQELKCLDCRILRDPRRPNTGNGDYVVRDYTTMLDHLELHSLSRHHVPAQTFIHMRRDQADQQDKGRR
ncbi:UNVERIFIED_ORG: hypothetical protein M2328_002765 [Rhodococcus erythropolis]